MDARRRTGILCGLAAFGLWGVMPLYFFAIKSISHWEILAQRILWSFVLLVAMLTVYRRWGDVATNLRSARSRRMYLASAVMLSLNWLIYIYGVKTGQTVETSLGYFINPLLNVALGMLIFQERLRPAQILALAMGALAVAILIVAAGTLPWIALSLAVSFAGYGLIRKIAPADAIVGLSIETLLLAPIALAFSIFCMARGEWQILEADPWIAALLVASGVITTIPLLCFGQAARTVPLSTLGFMQFISPSMQFVLAVTMLGEPLDAVRLTSFIFIWSGLAFYSIDAWSAGRRAKTDEFVNEQVVESAAAEA